MSRRGGSADLPLHGGRVPPWLAARMSALGAVLCQAIVIEYGRDELLRRLAHPFWFQSFGAMMGMDWHSSGITTSVIGALKRGLAPLSAELGLHVCGGRGRHSRATPAELLAVGERTGLDGAALAQASRLVAKVDSAAVQDGFDLYLHGFIVADDGRWVVVQQGMNGARGQARRYHWLSEGLESFVDAPHAAIDGPGQGRIVNLADRRAAASRSAQARLLADLGPDGLVRAYAKLPAARSVPRTSPEAPRGGHGRADADAVTGSIRSRASARARKARTDAAAPPTTGDLFAPSSMRDASIAPTASTAPLPAWSPSRVPHLSLPDHHDVRAGDVVLRRLHGALAAAAECGPRDFPELLQVPGVGARTVRALALVAEVLHGTPCRFTDPARFSLAHGGKDRQPFPVPTRVFDHTLGVLKAAVAQAKLGNEEKLRAIARLDAQARRLESVAGGPSLEAHIAGERRDAHRYGGRSVFGWEKPQAPAGPAAAGAPDKAG
ncbi:hypothetical protein B1992_08515 [Pseudoxanthomonas broegbernensis]|uniref:DUF763 domain-containing protein n=1 Tax=Pseudoxanthomonas broegbernensis TaxID=83619 RepID=A0A7V8GM94_9GAMM|nr:DUF763 domain-containing protein [Pseudoxanthomonas broegbernensis]KAF1686262.1 hypothetical protein B1992_08515 [Pseudoxanthomonas broegbernensis]MBB6063939.1 hypothetical protein [Pseudoxanthomonas broegbernensis]